MIVNLYTDGACKGNPGPGGWGVVIIKNGAPVDEIYGGEVNTTNNRMELLAVIHGLNKVEEGDTVRVNTDSMYVKNGITSWINKWVENGWKTAAKKDVANKDLWVKLQSIVEVRKVTWN
ncbi:ribonuclease HI, partial [Betaproteobacteria bacterium]|nr:ribonuclease HI [Betaproteobacteria bacterium]